MKIVHVRCLRCNEPITDHTRSMQIVASQDSQPKPGFSVNLNQCMATGGYRTGIQHDGSPAQQGEGRFRLSSKQFS